MRDKFKNVLLTRTHGKDQHKADGEADHAQMETGVRKLGVSTEYDADPIDRLFFAGFYQAETRSALTLADQIHQNDHEAGQLCVYIWITFVLSMNYGTIMPRDYMGLSITEERRINTTLSSRTGTSLRTTNIMKNSHINFFKYKSDLYL